MHSLDQDIHAVFLPAVGDLVISPPVAAFLDRGCRAILPGETREEYVARAMSSERIASETPDDFLSFARAASTVAGDDILIAVDQEMAGIQRLHRLVAPLPGRQALQTATEKEVETAAAVVARGAKALGVNMFLSPIVDVISGHNPWLFGRTLSEYADIVARCGAAFVRGAQAEGVVCTAKHFPGHHDITGDPATDASAVVTGGTDALGPGYDPFHAAIAAGTKAVMTGPAPVPSLDPEEAASTSRPVINSLRDSFGFQGLIVSDDLDSAAVMRGKSVAEKTVDALAAGSELLLVAAGDHLPELAEAVADAVSDGLLSAEQIRSAANKVRATVAWANA